jgi:Aspartyl protease
LKLRLENKLLFCTAEVRHQGQSLLLEHILLDTGSATTVIRVDHALELGLAFESSHSIRRMFGVGGTELVYRHHLDLIQVDDLLRASALVDVGDLQYGFELDGILGLDFLIANWAVIDLESMTLRPA